MMLYEWYVLYTAFFHVPAKGSFAEQMKWIMWVIWKCCRTPPVLAAQSMLKRLFSAPGGPSIIWIQDVFKVELLIVSVLLMLPRMPDVARVPSQSVLSEEIAEDKEAGKNERQGRINSKLDRRNRRVLQEMQWTDERKSPNLEGSWNVKN